MYRKFIDTLPDPTSCIRVKTPTLQYKGSYQIIRLMRSYKASGFTVMLQNSRREEIYMSSEDYWKYRKRKKRKV